jgi:hypothetical protein
MTAKLTFFPIGNADTTLIRLADDRLVLLDYADMHNPDDPYDKRCNLAAELKKELTDAGQKDFAVVCFTHLDDDHVCGSGDFFWLEHAAKYQVVGRPKIKEMWVPAAAITEEGAEDSARIIRQEARHRLKAGTGIKVFSRPDTLKAFLADNGLTLESRAGCIVDAGNTVPGFSKSGSEKAEFFVHCPFAWRSDERGLEDRNQDSVVLQVTFVEGGAETYGLFGSDVDHATISEIVRTTKRHKREGRLIWDVLKLFHHCSYKSLGPDRGVDETKAVPDVKWLFEEQSRDGCIIVSPSKPIPVKGSVEDEDRQPPHRQAANHHRRIVREKGGEFKVTMETPSTGRPKPFRIEITSYGARILLVAATPIGVATSTPARAG